MNGTHDMQGFLPDDYIERKSQLRTNILWSLIFAIVAAGIGAAWFIAQKKVREAESLNSQVVSEFTAATKLIEQFQQMQEAKEGLNKRAQLVQSLSERVNRSNILAELANKLPKGVTITELTLDGRRKSDEASLAAMNALDRRTKANQLTTARPILYDVTIHLKGLAFTDSQVIDYAKALSTCPLGLSVPFFKEDDVTFLGSDEVMVNERKMRSFELELIVNPVADSHAVASSLPKAKVE